MNRLRIAVGAIVISFGVSTFANGPMPENPAPTGSGTTMTPRQHWTHKRMKHLKQKMSDYKKAQQAANALGYATGEYVPQMHRNPAEVRQHMINRYEFLALKAERGKANANDIAEMRALQAALLGR